LDFLAASRPLGVPIEGKDLHGLCHGPARDAPLALAPAAALPPRREGVSKARFDRKFAPDAPARGWDTPNSRRRAGAAASPVAVALAMQDAIFLRNSKAF
jgi:hypothetical protein